MVVKYWKKNNQFLKNDRFYKYLVIPICPGKEYGVLDSEMYSVRRNLRLYYIALKQIQHSTHIVLTCLIVFLFSIAI